MEKMGLKKVRVMDLVAHPENRKVEREGEKWEEFLASVRERGVEVPLMVRSFLMDGVRCFEVLAGHRRMYAARECGLDLLDCVLVECTDREAVEFVWRENLERQELSFFDEACGVRALTGAGMAPGEVAVAFRRTLEWVQTRQLLLELGDTAVERAQLDKEDADHLYAACVQQLLPLDEEARKEAVQLILFPGFQDGTLRPQQAVDVIRRQVVEPRELRQLWMGAKEKFLAEWRKVLGDEVVIHFMGWDEFPGKNHRPVQEQVPMEQEMPEAPPLLSWQQLAAKHGAPVEIRRIGDAKDPLMHFAYVDEMVIRVAEASLAENGKEHWLVPLGKKDGTVSREVKAAAGVDVPGGEDEEPEEPEGVVIDQEIESRAVVDLMPVRRLKSEAEAEVSKQEHAFTFEEDCENPEHWPEWTRGMWAQDVVKVCGWIEGLKR